MKKMKKGFTLIELLIVIAIIGILAGVILVSTNSARTNANRSAAMQTLKSVMPYAAECFVNSINLTNPFVAGTAICAGSATVAPDIAASAEGWAWSAGSNTTYAATNATTAVTITCNAETTQCQ